MIAGIQGSRMNDQRAELRVFPGLNNSREVIGQYVGHRYDDNALDDKFFEMLMRCQVCQCCSRAVVMATFVLNCNMPHRYYFLNLKHKSQIS